MYTQCTFLIYVRKKYFEKIKGVNPENLSVKAIRKKHHSVYRERISSLHYEDQSQIKTKRIKTKQSQLPLLKQNYPEPLFFDFNESKSKKKHEKKNSVNTSKIEKNRFFDFYSSTYEGKRNYNEDRILIKTNLDINKQVFHLFAIFDGHGGSSTSQYLKIHFYKIFEKHLKETMKVSESLELSLNQIQEKILQFGNKIMSGSCATICVISENKYYVANVGDSRIIKIAKSGKYRQITCDHKPENEKQKERIEKEGGRIYREETFNIMTQQKVFGPFRILPSKLSISRTIGDNQFKKKNLGNILSSQADIFVGELQQGDTLVMMSDGGYEKFSNFQISERFFGSISMKEKVNKLLNHCKVRGTFDNVSIIGIKMHDFEQNDLSLN